jgi:hypothetical protein
MVKPKKSTENYLYLQKINTEAVEECKFLNIAFTKYMYCTKSSLMLFRLFINLISVTESGLFTTSGIAQ